MVESPQTLITTVATGDPGIAYEILYQAAVEHGGAFVAVTDDEAFRAMHVMAKMDGFSMEPAAAMACAGAIKMIRQGLIRPDETVVICCSGHTFPVEKAPVGGELVPPLGSLSRGSHRSCRGTDTHHGGQGGRIADLF
ncbi:MAG: pyridoxal-phosphate dependent enzyme [Ardenticatenia bacterium]|nr:pyridoxal-phosphate dependent enzyme [Ardenticatenia bacterium]